METSTPQTPESPQAEVLDSATIRQLQLEASRMQLRMNELTGDEHARYEEVMRTLKANGADDWGD